MQKPKNIIKIPLKRKKKQASEINVKKGTGWFEKAMQELEKQEKKQ